MDYGILLWAGIAALAVLVELYTRTGVAAMFVPSGALAAVLSFVWAPLWVEIAAFLGLTLFLLLLRALLLSRRKGGTRLEVEAALGAHCTVTETVDNRAGAGLVSYGGNDWAAKSLSDDEILEAGSTVTVVAVEGVKLICKK